MTAELRWFRSRSRAPPQAAATDWTMTTLRWCTGWFQSTSAGLPTAAERRGLQQQHRDWCRVGQGAIRVANDLTTCFTDTDVSVVDNTLPMASQGNGTDVLLLLMVPLATHERGENSFGFRIIDVTLNSVAGKHRQLTFALGWRCDLWRPLVPTIDNVSQPWLQHLPC